jgi:hypothetical protein
MAEETQPLEFRVPDEHVEEILTIMDAERSRLNRYRLWKRLEEIFPELVDDKKTFGLDQRGSRLYVLEDPEAD